VRLKSASILPVSFGGRQAVEAAVPSSKRSLGESLAHP